jgi:polyisoprenoid-binding protein YceI
MKKLVMMMVLLGAAIGAYAQKYMTRTGKVSFFSATSLENIEAFNNEVASVLDAKTGDVVFQVPIKSFKFEKALMQEHFNENYMESDKYPKAEFKGKVTDISSVNFAKDGTYNVKTTGKLTMHGVTKDVTVPGTITVKGKDVTTNTKFKVKTADYNISIPKLVEGKIAKEIEVTVNSILSQK